MSHSTVGLLQSLDALRATVLERDALAAENERLRARVGELEELLSDWRMSVDMVRSAGIDSAHGAKMVRNGVEQRMYAAATKSPDAGARMCKHDDGDCHADDPCDDCPVYRKQPDTPAGKP